MLHKMPLEAKIKAAYQRIKGISILLMAKVNYNEIEGPLAEFVN